MKTPALVEHFIEHRTQNEQLSFWEFLSMHYANGDVQDADHDKDMKLPFKSHEHCSCNITAFVPLLCQPEPVQLMPIAPKTFGIYHEDFFKVAYLSSIWQPPKSC